MTKFIKKLFNDEKGATAIEYGLIAALIAVAAIAAMSAVGSSLSNTFNSVAGELETSSDAAADAGTGGETAPAA